MNEQQKTALDERRSAPLGEQQGPAEFRDYRDDIVVSEALLDEMAYDYASEYLQEEERDAFVERMAEDAYRVLMRNIFCTAVIGVNAALQLRDEAVFRSVAQSLDTDVTDDEQMRAMLRFMFTLLGDQAKDASGNEAQLRARVEYLASLV